jgi:hypothetical protein
MKCRYLVPLAAALLLCGEGAAVAARAASRDAATDKATTQKAKPAIYHRMGTISSVTGSNLLLERKANGKEQNTDFVLNSDTKKEGTLNKGEKATIYYRMDKKQRIATDVKVMEPKSKTESKKS